MPELLEIQASVSLRSAWIFPQLILTRPVPFAAPHFAATLLIPVAPSTQPSIHLNLLQLDSIQLFSFALHVLASPALMPSPTMHDRACAMVKAHFETTISALRKVAIPLFANSGGVGAGNAQEEISLAEGVNWVLGIYPRIPEEGGPNYIDPSPAQLANIASLPLDSQHRQLLLQSLVTRFSSPLVVFQSLSSISPGAPPSSKAAIPLSSILFELGDSLTSDEGIVHGIVERWWAGILDHKNKEEGETEVEAAVADCLSQLVQGREEGREIDVNGVIRGLALNVS